MPFLLSGGAPSPQPPLYFSVAGTGGKTGLRGTGNCCPDSLRVTEETPSAPALPNHQKSSPPAPPAERQDGRLSPPWTVTPACARAAWPPGPHPPPLPALLPGLPGFCLTALLRGGLLGFQDHSRNLSLPVLQQVGWGSSVAAPCLLCTFTPGAFAPGKVSRSTPCPAL